MELSKRFEEIRPYRDHEVKKVIAELLADDAFLHILEKIYPQKEECEQVIAILKTLDNVVDFQYKIIRPLVGRISQMSTDSFDLIGKENFDTQKSHIFISNHRDIVLDPAFLNVGAINNDIKATEIAIGSNLLIYKWITDLVKLNRSFVVKRDIPVKQMMEASETLSNYIRNSVIERDRSVWIAQKEGRTKDGIDRTQVALLKMINISNPNDSTRQGFLDLDIVPLALSYEIEPCGGLKVLELLRKKHEPDYKKSPGEDLRSMGAGIIRPKGRVVFKFGKPINEVLSQTEEIKNKNKQLKVVAEIIDKSVIENYTLWPFNFIAHDKLNQSDRFKDQYTQDDIDRFEKLTAESLSIIEEHKEEAVQLWLEMYANPLQSKIDFNLL